MLLSDGLDPPAGSHQPRCLLGQNLLKASTNFRNQVLLFDNFLKRGVPGSLYLLRSLSGSHSHCERGPGCIEHSLGTSLEYTTPLVPPSCQGILPFIGNKSCQPITSPATTRCICSDRSIRPARPICYISRRGDRPGRFACMSDTATSFALQAERSVQRDSLGSWDIRALCLN